jgi:hypothetical protein
MTRYDTIRNVALLILMAALAARCSDEQQILPTSPTTNTTTNTNNNSTTITITFPNPTPPTGGGGTGNSPVPDILPLPLYTNQVITQVYNSNTSLLLNSCVAQFGPTAWAFIDAVVDALRVRDQRFGYLCTGTDCANPVPDVITYRATQDPSLGVHIVDVIESYCVSPVLNVNNLGFSPNGRYSTRNRF